MDLNLILIPLIYLSALASAISGILLVAQSFFSFRAHTTSLTGNPDLEHILWSNANPNQLNSTLLNVYN